VDPEEIVVAGQATRMGAETDAEEEAAAAADTAEEGGADGAQEG